MSSQFSTPKQHQVNQVSMQSSSKNDLITYPRWIQFKLQFSLDWKIYCDIIQRFLRWFCLWLAGMAEWNEVRGVSELHRLPLLSRLAMQRSSNYRLGLINIYGLTTNWELHCFRFHIFISLNVFLVSVLMRSLIARFSLSFSEGCHHQVSESLCLCSNEILGYRSKPKRRRSDVHKWIKWFGTSAWSDKWEKNCNWKCSRAMIRSASGPMCHINHLSSPTRIDILRTKNRNSFPLNGQLRKIIRPEWTVTRSVITRTFYFSTTVSFFLHSIRNDCVINQRSLKTRFYFRAPQTHSRDSG